MNEEIDIRDKVTQNGETIEIDQVIEIMERAPDRKEVLESLRSLRQDRVKQALQQTIRAATFDLKKVFQEFLEDGEKATRTRTTYQREFARFRSFLEREGLHIFQVRRADINRYKRYLADRYSANTVRLSLATASTFYRYVEAEGYIEYQPFAMITYPRKQYKKAIQPDQGAPVPVMSEEEYQAIVEALDQKAKALGDMVYDRASRESARRLLPLIHFMATYGLRIGDTLTVRLEEGDRFSYRQKGGQIRRKSLRPVSQEILSESGNLKRQPFKDMAKVTVQGALRRLNKKLADRGVIRHAYSAHDFRHLYAVRLYQETKNVYAVKEALGHSTVAVTEIYLAGLRALGSEI